MTHSWFNPFPGLQPFRVYISFLYCINAISHIFTYTFVLTLNLAIWCLYVTTLSSPCQWTPLLLLVPVVWLKMAYLGVRPLGRAMWLKKAASYELRVTSNLIFNLSAFQSVNLCIYWTLPVQSHLCTTYYEPCLLDSTCNAIYYQWLTARNSQLVAPLSGECRSRTDDLLLAKQAL